MTEYYYGCHQCLWLDSAPSLLDAEDLHANTACNGNVYLCGEFRQCMACGHTIHMLSKLQQCPKCGHPFCDICD